MIQIDDLRKLSREDLEQLLLYYVNSIEYSVDDYDKAMHRLNNQLTDSVEEKESNEHMSVNYQMMSDVKQTHVNQINMFIKAYILDTDSAKNHVTEFNNTANDSER